MGIRKNTSWAATYDDVYFLDDREWNFDLHDHVHGQLRGGAVYRPLQHKLRIRAVRSQGLKPSYAKTCLRRVQLRHSSSCAVQI